MPKSMLLFARRRIARPFLVQHCGISLVNYTCHLFVHASKYCFLHEQSCCQYLNKSSHVLPAS